VQYVNHIVLAAVVVTAMGGVGCKRGTITEREAAPDVQTSATSNAAVNTTVTGCLRAGNADGTYVVMEARSAGGTQAATYQLIADNTDELKAHLNQPVQVVGTITSGQDIASRSTRVEEDKKAKGTTGTPVVETTTDLQLRRLRVKSITPQGESCQ
jgi:hypothetical protein